MHSPTYPNILLLSESMTKLELLIKLLKQKHPQNDCLNLFIHSLKGHKKISKVCKRGTSTHKDDPHISAHKS